MLLGEKMRSFHLNLSAYARRFPELRYYYVTAQEMASLVHQAERGEELPNLEEVAGAQGTFD